MRMPREICKRWYDKAEIERDEFDRFIYLWFGFNALYNQYLFDSERSAINNFLSSNDCNISRTEILEVLQSSSSIFFQNRVIKDCRGKNTDSAEDVLRIKNLDNTPKTRLKFLIKVIYLVRCNLLETLISMVTKKGTSAQSKWNQFLFLCSKKRNH